MSTITSVQMGEASEKGQTDYITIHKRFFLTSGMLTLLSRLPFTSPLLSRIYRSEERPRQQKSLRDSDDCDDDDEEAMDTVTPEWHHFPVNRFWFLRNHKDWLRLIQAKCCQREAVYNNCAQDPIQQHIMY